MAPNLYLATINLFTPHKWRVFEKKKTPRPEPAAQTERWKLPIPGIYEKKPGRGWYLISRDDGEPVPQPEAVSYCRALDRYLIKSDYESRKRYDHVEVDGTYKRLGFFRADDIAWVQCWDGLGNFTPGPYKRYCIDEHTGKFREMLKGDDPGWQSRRSSRQSIRSSRSSQDRKYSNGSSNSRTSSRSRQTDQRSDSCSTRCSHSNSRAPSLRQPARHSIAGIVPRASISSIEAKAAISRDQRYF